MGRTYKPKVKLYTEASINAAINEVYKTAKKYHMSISMLRSAKETSTDYQKKKKAENVIYLPK